MKQQEIIEKIKAEIEGLKKRYKDQQDFDNGWNTLEKLSSFIENLEQTAGITTKPKFKVGDWVWTEGGREMKILEVHENTYTILSWDGLISTRLISDIDSTCRIWTIRDAEFGDVLYDKKGNRFIFVFMGIDVAQIRAYVRYCAEFDFVATGYTPYLYNIRAKEDDIVPATQEQKDLLFSKLAEAGYVWDSEKKSVERIKKGV